MLAKEIMTKNILCVSPDDNISKVISIIEKENVHEVIVIEKRRLKGIVYARRLVTKTIQDPGKTKVFSIMDSPPAGVSPDAEINEVSKVLLNSGLRLVCVVEKGECVGVVSITDVMEIASKSKILKQTPASAIMSSPNVVGFNESIGKARVFMREKNITHLPVVDEEGKLKGLITTFDIIKTAKPKERIGFFSMEGEMERLMGIPVSTITNMKPITTSKETSLSDICDLMTKNNISGIIIVENKYPVGIITPKDLLEFYVSGLQVKGIYYQIIGLTNEDEFIVSTAQRMIEDSLTKISKMYKIFSFFVHVKKYQEHGEKAKYSIRTRLRTEKGIHISKSYDWDLRDAINSAMKKLEREIIKRKTETRERRRRMRADYKEMFK